MTTAIETFREELFARVQAATFVDVTISQDSIRRTHKTNPPREQCPAIHVFFPGATPKAVKSCRWDWRVPYRISVYGVDAVPSDAHAMVDRIVEGLLPAINPEAEDSTATPTYSNGVTLEPPRVVFLEDLGDADPVRVDIEGEAQLNTRAWSMQA